MTYYRPLTPADLPRVFSMELRQADRDEIKAATGLDPRKALFLSINVSERVWVVVHNGEIEGVFGVSRSGAWGVPWFLATDKFMEFRMAFAKESKAFVKGLLEEYETLCNYVDSRHEASIRWLEWLGFTVQRTGGIVTLHDPNVPFYCFTMTRKEEDTSACAYPQQPGQQQQTP